MTEQRSWGALLVAVGSVLAVLGASVAVFAYYDDRTSPTEPAAARWFADHAVWASSTDADGNQGVLTSLTGARGLEPAGILPLVMELGVEAEAAAHPGSQLWTAVTAARYPDGNHLDVPEMYLASEEGITQLVGVATIILPVAFDPPLPVLPAEVQTGARWEGNGKASFGTLELYDYRVTGEVTAVDDDGCATVQTSTSYHPTEDGTSFGATAYDDSGESRFCPGRWVTGYTSSTGTTRAVTSPTARRVLAGFEAAQLLEPPDAADRPDQPRRLLLHGRDRGSYGSADTLVVPGARVALDADSASNTVTAAVWDQDLPVPMWRLVGEGPTVVAPVSAGGSVVLADTHGLVTAVDAASGFVLWQRSVGHLPTQVAVDAHGLYVAVLDHDGSARLLTLGDGRTVTTVDAGDEPVGVAVATDDAGPVVVVADGSSVRGYDVDGDELFDVDATPTTGPVAMEAGVYVGTADGEVLRVAADGTVTERYLGEVGVTDLVVATSTVALLDDRDHLRLLDRDLLPIATVEDDAIAVTAGVQGDAEVFTTTAADGETIVYDADGRRLRTVRVPVTPEDDTDSFALEQHAAAVTWDGVVWASGRPGLLRWEAP